ncbi:MAG TPA: 5-dehydro-2-deoxygluconokinase [Candidatus Hydrogenedentes bacterium]|nr:5-dehydro-2-deoxygluconokinase [Candidatus Hydrogenedentota bacterium]HPG70068.1 5-dehydro-2-deoxygluconokinase [Candidatus Hydrogenedentota bacterium]
MSEVSRTYDTLHMGRSSIDLYSNDVGAPFTEITSFAAYVGGSPTNISVGGRRLGLKTALLTGLGVDPVGDFLLDFLEKEGVETKFVVRKPGHRTSAVILGIEPPDKFPLVYYRDNCADIELSIDDVLAAPVADSRVFQFAGTNLSKEPSRSATMFAAELARRAGTEVVFDIDFRPDQWHDPRAFGVVARSVLPLVDIVLGTQDELNALMLADAAQMNLTHSQVSDTKVSGDVDAAIRFVLSAGPKALLQKVGAQGIRVHVNQPDGSRETLDVPGFPVEVYNILGAGDAFAAGFLFGHVRGLGWYKAGRIAAACGAIVVTKHGCANFMPTYDEVMAFIDSRGGI